MLNDREWDLIARYVAGEFTSEHRPALERWIHEDQDRIRTVAELRRIWDNRNTHVDSGAAWLRFKARTATQFTFARATRTVPTPFWFKAAAVVALLAGGALIARSLVSERRTASIAGAAMNETAATRRGEIRNLRLKDGTEVTLGMASRLLVAADFGEHARIVQIEGDAYFDVAHDVHRAFIVRTANATAQAIGTEFGVSVRDRGRTRVVVAGGRVIVKRTAAEAHSQAVVSAGEVAEVTSSRDTVVVEVADPARLLAWREGRLVFQNQPLTEVLEQLEYWYDVEFEIADTVLAQRRMSGSFVRPSLEQVLQAITLSTQAAYRVDDRRVILTNR